MAVPLAHLGEWSWSLMHHVTKLASFQIGFLNMAISSLY